LRWRLDEAVAHAQRFACRSAYAIGDAADPLAAIRGSLTGEMTARKSFRAEEARRVGEQIGIDWASAPFDVEQFRRGMDVELEHGAARPAHERDSRDPIVTGKIALAHLNEFADYYTRLERMEEEAKREQGS
jgi:hypothetical protein